MVLKWSCSVIGLLFVMYVIVGQSDAVFRAQDVDFMKDVIADGE